MASYSQLNISQFINQRREVWITDTKFCILVSELKKFYDSLKNNKLFMKKNCTLNPDDLNEFDDCFLRFICSKSQLFCYPITNTIEEEEYHLCKPAYVELEQFVFGSDKLETDVSQASSVCGKIFKNREPIYTCQECSTDNTCVLCRTCFLKSEHVKHNYMMFSSSGGGYCDCGDAEAWKTFPRCSLHGGNSSTSSNVVIGNYDCQEDIDHVLAKLPTTLKTRFLMLSKQIFDRFEFFIMRPLCKENDEIRQTELERELSFIKSECPDVEGEEYGLVLYNNEIHNFDQVINLFKRSLTCSPEQAMEYANIVDRDGRCVALTMNVLKDIESKQQDILVRSKAQTKVELLCRLHHPTVLSIQSFMLHTLRWLYEFADQYPGLRMLLAQYLFNDVTTGDGQHFPRSRFIRHIFDNHIQTWKMARSVMANFLMTVVMKESFFKKLFAVEFVTNYKMIIDHYAIDDHNMQDSLVTLSCQIFTIISLATYLLENNSVLSVVVDLAYLELLKHSTPLKCDGVEYRDIYVFHKDEVELQKKFDPFERRLKSLDDVNFLLTSLLTSFTGYEGDRDSDSASQDHIQPWTELCVNNFKDYFATFSMILSLIHETNTIERVTEHHIEHDPQWRTGIILMYDLVSCITLTGNLVVSNPVCWDMAFDIFRHDVTRRIIMFESKKQTVYEYNTYKAHVIENNCPNKFVSVIKPMHRFMAALLVQACYRDRLTDVEVDCLFDQALQMVVFSSQQSGNMWIRNGSVPYILTQQMKCLALSSEMFDRDLQLIQQLALCMRPEEFIVKCIHKFDLKNFLSSSYGILSEKKSLIQRMEDFLHLIIMTLFFRHRPKVGKGITREMCYEHLILHILSVKPLTHSKIIKKLPATIQKYPKLTEIIDKVSDQSKQSQIVMFSAKKSLIASTFDRFSLYYSIQDRNEAELYVHSVLKKDGVPVVLSLPPPIELTEEFAKLYLYLSDPCLIRVMDRVLTFCNDKRNGEYWTDTMLDMVLCIIGACLTEDVNVLNMSKQDRRPMFIETATRSDLHIQIIDNLELLCDKINADHQLELIKWTIRKWHEVRRKMIFDQLPIDEKVTGMDLDTQQQDTEMETLTANNIYQAKIIKADAAKVRREQLMNKMKIMQKKFINDNVDLLMMEPGDQENKQQNLTNDARPTDLDLTCILCQEKSDSITDRPIVAIAGAWRSTVLAKHPFTSHGINATESNDDLSTPILESDVNETHFMVLQPEPSSYDESTMSGDIDRVVVRSILPMVDHPEETFITTCGHVMHYDCKTRYMNDMIKQKQNIARTKGVLYPRIYNRCPLCKCVCNIDIPIIRQQTTQEALDGDLCVLDGNSNVPTMMSFDDWVTVFRDWTGSIAPEIRKTDKPMTWWDKLSHKLSSIMKMANPLKRNDSQASNDELLACLAFRVGLAIKLQPGKLTKDTYYKYESICSSISESSLQDVIELDYAVAYTTSVWEQILSKNCLSLLTDMPERHMTGLYYLMKAVLTSHEQLSEKDSMKRNYHSFLVLLQQLLFDCTKSSLHRDWLDLHKYKSPVFILEVDFTFLITTLLFMRSSFRDQANFSHKSVYNANVVRLIFQFVSVQALLSLHSVHVDNAPVTFAQLQTHSPHLWTEQVVDGLVNLRLELFKRLPTLQCTPLDKHQVVVCFTRAVIPYLRCATFFLTSLGSVPQQTQFDNCDAEFNQLFSLLGLSMLPDTVDRLPAYLLSHLGIIEQHCLEGDLVTVWGTKLPFQMPFAPPTLIDLPLDFTDVLTRCLDQGCSLRTQATGTVSEMTLCLVCGDTFCLNGYCCRRQENSSLNFLSGAQIHARQCHGGYSLFLNTKNSKIVVMFNQARWLIYLDPIYMDKFGEIDVDLKKGNPLFLNSDAYGKLQRSWLDHSIGCIVNDGFLSNDFFV